MQAPCLTHLESTLLDFNCKRYEPGRCSDNKGARAKAAGNDSARATLFTRGRVRARAHAYIHKGGSHKLQPPTSARRGRSLPHTSYTISSCLSRPHLIWRTRHRIDSGGASLSPGLKPDAPRDPRKTRARLLSRGLPPPTLIKGGASNRKKPPTAWPS